MEWQVEGVACDEDLRDSSNARDNGVIAEERDNAANVADSTEKLELTSPSSTPKRNMERSFSTPSRIIGGARLSESKNAPSSEVDKTFLEGIVEVKSLKQESKALKQENEYFRERVTQSLLSTSTSSLAGFSSLQFMIGGMPVYPADYMDTKFQDVGAIAKGGFGIVYTATHRLELEKYAVKRIDLNEKLLVNGEPSDELYRAMQEVMSLKELKHESIVGYYDCWIQPRGSVYALFIQMELCDKSLSDLLRDKTTRRCTSSEGRFEVFQELKLFKQLCKTVEFIHSKGLIHYDLNPRNCLITYDGDLKVADLGLARRPSLRKKKVFRDDDGTRDYHSPEQAEGGAECGMPVDIFSVGLIFVQMFDPVHRSSSDWKNIFEEIRQGGISTEILCAMKKKYPGTLEFLASMTKRSPSERLTAPMVLDELTRLVHKSSDEALLVKCKFKDGLDDAWRPLHLAIRLVQEIIPQTPEVDFSLKRDGVNLKFPRKTELSAIRKVIDGILDTVSDVSLVHYNGVTYKSRIGCSIMSEE